MVIRQTTETLCLLNDVKTRLNLDTADDVDGVLEGIIQGVTGAFDMECERYFLLNQNDETEYYDGGKEIHLKRYPVESITSIKISNDWDWANVDALDSDIDYRLKADDGVVYYTTSYGWPWEPADMEGNFPTGLDSLQIIYKGGYVGPGGEVGTNQTGLPYEVREAAIRQTIYEYKNRHTSGMQNYNAEGQSVNKASPDDYLKYVKRVMARYHR